MKTKSKTKKTKAAPKLAWVLSDGGLPVAATTMVTIAKEWGKCGLDVNQVAMILTTEDLSNFHSSE